MGCGPGKEQSKYGMDESQEATSLDANEKEKIAAQKNKPRRPGVSAEPAGAPDPNWVAPKYEKSDEARRGLIEKIKANRDCQVLIGHLDDSVLDAIVDAFFPKVVPDGENLITQGDEGDYFYIVETGRFDIFVTRGSPPVTGKVMTAEPGAIFGQLALLYNAPRAATCTSVGESQVWAMDRETFRNMLISDESTKKKTYESFLENVEILQHLNTFERSKVADLLVPEHYNAGDDIIVQGATGDAFYFLEKGTADVYIAGDAGEIKVLTYDKKGQYFGEIALLTESVRRATVRSGPRGCNLLKLEKADFERSFLPLKQTMVTMIDKYPKYAEFITSDGVRA
jgi:cAMP-dependent protein kinase regulator